MLSFLKRNRYIIRAGAVFALLACGSIVGLSTATMQRGPVKAFTSTIAWVASVFLRLFDSSVIAAGSMVQSSRFQIEIVNACNGVYVTALLVSAVLATPAPWRRRLPGILIGALLIYFVNLARTVSLFLIGSYGSMEAFHFVHVYVWQTVVVLVSVAFFLGWVGTIPAPGTGSEGAGGGDAGESAGTERADNPAMDRGSSAV